MLIIHELKTERKNFESSYKGEKNFEICKSNQNFKKNDLVLIKECQNGKYTGFEILRLITFVSDYEQKQGFVVLSLKYIPVSFQEYIKMSDKEKEVFKTVIAHDNLYGFGGRETANTFREIIDELIDHRDLSREDMILYRDYWDMIK